MDKIEIDTKFGDNPTHIEISAPHGLGGKCFFVMINKYYHGDLLKAYDGWRIHLHPTTMLQGDDVSIIIDLIELELAGLGRI